MSIGALSGGGDARCRSAKRVYFQDRTLRHLLDFWVAKRINTGTRRDRIAAAIRSNHVELKRIDARCALMRSRSIGRRMPRPIERPWTLARTDYLNRLMLDEAIIEPPSGPMERFAVVEFPLSASPRRSG